MIEFSNIFVFIKKQAMFICFLCILVVLSFWVSRISPAPPQTHFVDLAASFLRGHLYVDSFERLFDDVAVYNNHTYIYYGPVPALLFIPFVFVFGRNFPQEILSPIIGLINFILIYRICRKNNIQPHNSLWLSTFFIFATVYLMLSLTAITSYFVQIIGIMFLLLALDEFFDKKRWFLIGFFIILATGTRQTLLLSSFFFLIELIKTKADLNKKLANTFYFFTPILFGLSLLALYNLVRFGSLSETGYSYQTNSNPIYIKAKSYGLFSLKHIPGNLYFFFLKGPDPIRNDSVSYVLKPPFLRINEWGLGILFTSPLFMYLITLSKNTKHLLSSTATILVMMFPLLTYFGIGVWQYGYRYGLDFYPFLFLLLIMCFKEKLPFLAKGLIIYGIIFNLLFMYSIWDKYPFMIR